MGSGCSYGFLNGSSPGSSKASCTKMPDFLCSSIWWERLHTKLSRFSFCSFSIRKKSKKSKKSRVPEMNLFWDELL
jgi:hypothetical protein